MSIVKYFFQDENSSTRFCKMQRKAGNGDSVCTMSLFNDRRHAYEVEKLFAFHFVFKFSALMIPHFVQASKS